MANDIFPRSSSASVIVERAWIEILDRHSLEQNQPFDEAGGDSLKLMHLVLLLERATRKNLSVDAFHSGLRPSEMVTLLQPKSENAGSDQIVQPTLFLFPGLGGHDPQVMRIGIACADMVRLERVAYPSWTSLIDRPKFDFNMLVKLVVAQIASRHLNGPVMLAGYSFGGIVAFAAALELLCAGYEVCFLGLLDSDALLGSVQPSPTPASKPRSLSRRQELGNILHACQHGDGAEMLAHVVVRRLKGPRWKPAVWLAARIPKSWLPRNFGIYLYRDLQTWYFQPLLRQWADFSRMLPPTNVRSFLFRTDDHPETALSGLGWEDRCQNLTIIPIPGTHLKIFESPNLLTLTEEFARAIAQSLPANPS